MSEIYQSLIVSGNNKEKRVDALIDTGANINVLNYRFAIQIYNKSYLDEQFKINLSHVNVSKKIKIKGIFIWGGLIIGGVSEGVSFFVTKENFGTQVLIGVPALQRNASQFDFIKDKIHFRKLSKRKGNWI